MRDTRPGCSRRIGDDDGDVERLPEEQVVVGAVEVELVAQPGELAGSRPRPDSKVKTNAILGPARLVPGCTLVMVVVDPACFRFCWRTAIQMWCPPCGPSSACTVSPSVQRQVVGLTRPDLHHRRPGIRRLADVRCAVRPARRIRLESLRRHRVARARPADACLRRHAGRTARRARPVDRASTRPGATHGGASVWSGTEAGLSGTNEHRRIRRLRGPGRALVPVHLDADGGADVAAGRQELHPRVGARTGGQVRPCWAIRPAW